MKKVYKCDECDKEYKTERGLKSHKFAVHEVLKEEKSDSLNEKIEDKSDPIEIHKQRLIDFYDGRTETNITLTQLDIVTLFECCAVIFKHNFNVNCKTVVRQIYVKMFRYTKNMVNKQ